MSRPSIRLPDFNNSPLTISFSILFVESPTTTSDIVSDTYFSAMDSRIDDSSSDLFCFSCILYASLNLSLYSESIFDGKLLISSSFSPIIQGSLAAFFANLTIESITILYVSWPRITASNIVSSVN